MRYLMFVKSDERSEAGAMPTEQELADMTAYNERLVEAGVMLDGNGLAPSADGARVIFDESNTPIVVDGPFTKPKDLVAGYWVLDVSSREEAVEWARRAPLGPGGQIEIRRILTDEDFGDSLTPELREAEARMRDAEAHRREELAR
ncbi:YciI family protein [Saccharomonospora viridis]|uniref:YciI family protein n=1 Tax=Saccharomonospora viridis TaxID=1852 RepID=UPI0023EFF8DA|nr:YciI family protein [Saccharomonospora viridis]